MGCLSPIKPNNSYDDRKGSTQFRFSDQVFQASGQINIQTEQDTHNEIQFNSLYGLRMYIYSNGVLSTSKHTGGSVQYFLQYIIYWISRKSVRQNCPMDSTASWQRVDVEIRVENSNTHTNAIRTLNGWAEKSVSRSEKNGSPSLLLIRSDRFEQIHEHKICSLGEFARRWKYARRSLNRLCFVGLIQFLHTWWNSIEKLYVALPSSRFIVDL